MSKPCVFTFENTLSNISGREYAKISTQTTFLLRLFSYKDALIELLSDLFEALKGWDQLEPGPAIADSILLARRGELMRVTTIQHLGIHASL